MKHTFKKGDTIAYIPKSNPTCILLDTVKKDKNGRLYFDIYKKIYLSKIDKVTNYEICLLPNPDKDFLKALYSIDFLFDLRGSNET